MDETALRREMERYKFYHIIQLTDTVATPGNPMYVPAQNLCLKSLKTMDLKGKRVLDVGCRDGLLSFAAESLGAAEVIGIDNDLSKPATEFLIPFFQSKVRIEKMNLYDLKPGHFGLFDVVICAGVLYHLRYPFWGLKALRDVMNIGGHLLIETALWRGDRGNAVLYCPLSEDGPYQPTSCSFFNEKGLVDTLTAMGFQTIAVEALGREEGREGRKGFSDRARRRLAGWKRLVTDPKGRQKRKVRRSVCHSVFRGYDQGSFITQYWESTHDFHTRYGG